MLADEYHQYFWLFGPVFYPFWEMEGSQQYLELENEIKINSHAIYEKSDHGFPCQKIIIFGLKMMMKSSLEMVFCYKNCSDLL